MEIDRQKTAQTKQLTKLFKTYNVWSFFGYNKMHMRIIAMAAIYRNKTHAYASSDKKKFDNWKRADWNWFVQHLISRDLLSFRLHHQR